MNIPLDKIYPFLLEYDEQQLNNLFEVDLWDSQYDKDVITSVEYVLIYRNQDIASLEIKSTGFCRIITSNLAVRACNNTL